MASWLVDPHLLGHTPFKIGAVSMSLDPLKDHAVSKEPNHVCALDTHCQVDTQVICCLMYVET